MNTLILVLKLPIIHFLNIITFHFLTNGFPFLYIFFSLTSDTELTIPNTKHRFFITVDASLIGLGAVLFQLNEQNKMKVIQL